MTHINVADMVKSIGLPYAYYQFPEGTAQELPFVVFFFSGSDDLYADQQNYQKISTLNIELYTKEKDFAQDEAIEKILNDNGLTYYKEENYIDSEKMWQTAYECDVVITEIVTT